VLKIIEIENHKGNKLVPRIIKPKKMNEKKFIQSLFELINNNKKYPSYQAERRVDIFINFFLEDILTSYFPKSKVKFIASEFPLKKENNNQSTNVDFLCVKETNDNKTILFVELKTDAFSFDANQFNTYLHYKKEQNWNFCVEGIKRIALSKNLSFSTRLKYYHLVKKLFQSGLIDYQKERFDEIELIIKKEHSASQNDKQKYKQKFYYLFQNIIFDCSPISIEVVYLAPDSIRNNKGFNDQEVHLISLNRLPDNVAADYSEIWKLLIEMLNKY